MSAWTVVLVAPIVTCFLFARDWSVRVVSSLFRRQQPEQVRINRNGKQPISDYEVPPKRTQLDADKELYHRLQNAEYYPESLLDGRDRLIQLLDQTVASAQAEPEGTILGISPFSIEYGLTEFMQRADAATEFEYEAYLGRRKTGGSRELLSDRAYAEYWVRTAAPVKYVDGSWLGGLHRAATSFNNRKWTKHGWQILSEELGDGNLTKNHVYVYEKLVNGFANIGRGDEKKFISDAFNPNDDERVWMAAVAQLCVCLFPNAFLPEILGFNLAYESLPLHLLVTIHEMKELGLDPYYFVLHIVIDNADSGHAAIGLGAVLGLLRSTPSADRGKVWRRVQAGFILAEGLPTTPTPPSELFMRVRDLFARKCNVSRPMHACCPAKIGGGNGKPLTEWLNPELYQHHSYDFLISLAGSRWISKGHPERSKLVQEMKWGGRMFGAFTADEVSLVEQWITELDLQGFDTHYPSTGSYSSFIGISEYALSISAQNFAVPAIQPKTCFPTCSFASLDDLLAAPRIFLNIENSRLGSLLIASAVLFERLPSYPAKCGTPKGMAAVRILRALYGFLPETELVAGMDEFTRTDEVAGVVEIGRQLGGAAVEVAQTIDPLVGWVMACSKSPERNYSVLLGAQLGFIRELYGQQILWSERCGLRDCASLREITRRCENAVCGVISECDWSQVCGGFNRIRSELGEL